MLATISEFFETSYPTYEAGESRKSEFSVLPLFGCASSEGVHHVMMDVNATDLPDLGLTPEISN